MAIGEIFPKIGEAFVAIFKPIFVDPSLFWYLGPILVFWLVLEVYFSKYKSEQLGWNTALGNGLSVFWVLVISMKFLFDNHMENFAWSKLIALILIAIYALLIIINSFTHHLKEKASFLLASPTATYFLSGLAIVWTHGRLEITRWVLVALIIFYGFVLVIDFTLKRLIKGSDSGLGDMGLGKDEFKEPSLDTGNKGNLGGLGRL